MLKYFTLGAATLLGSSNFAEAHDFCYDYEIERKSGEAYLVTPSGNVRDPGDPEDLFNAKPGSTFSYRGSVEANLCGGETELYEVTECRKISEDQWICDTFIENPANDDKLVFAGGLDQNNPGAGLRSIVIGGTGGGSKTIGTSSLPALSQTWEAHHCWVEDPCTIPSPPFCPEGFEEVEYTITRTDDPHNFATYIVSPNGSQKDLTDPLQVLNAKPGSTFSWKGDITVNFACTNVPGFEVTECRKVSEVQWICNTFTQGAGGSLLWSGGIDQSPAGLSEGMNAVVTGGTMAGAKVTGTSVNPADNTQVWQLRHCFPEDGLPCDP